MVNINFEELNALAEETILLENRLYYPRDKGLMSLESYLYGTTTVSQEGVLSKIKSVGGKISSKLNSGYENTLTRLNSVLSKVRLLSKEQEHRLQLVKQGKLSINRAKLPISRDTIRIAIRGVLAILAALAAKKISDKMASSIPNDDKAYKEAHKAAEEAKSTRDSVKQHMKQRQEQYKKSKDNGASPEDLKALEKVILGLKKRVTKYSREARGNEFKKTYIKGKANAKIYGSVGLSYLYSTALMAGIGCAITLITNAVKGAYNWIKNKITGEDF